MIAPKESQLEASLTLKAGLNPRPLKQQKHTINQLFPAFHKYGNCKNIWPRLSFFQIHDNKKVEPCVLRVLLLLLRLFSL